MCCEGMFDGAISQMCKVMVLSMRLIGGNLLKTLLLILMSSIHRSYLLQVLYVLISSYCRGTDRVVIVSIWVFQCMCKWTGSQRMGWMSIILHADGRGL